MAIVIDGRSTSNGREQSLAQNGEALRLICYTACSMKMKLGNTVGSKFVFTSAEDFYILGLWLADGYWRSSSIGLTSVNQQLIEKFTLFLLRISNNPIKKRIYFVDGISKRKQNAIQVYVNSRPLVRLFMSTKTGDLNIPKPYLSAYLAGRIDGDGHVDTKHRSAYELLIQAKKMH